MTTRWGRRYGRIQRPPKVCKSTPREAPVAVTAPGVVTATWNEVSLGGTTTFSGTIQININAGFNIYQGFTLDDQGRVILCNVLWLGPGFPLTIDFDPQGSPAPDTFSGNTPDSDPGTRPWTSGTANLVNALFDPVGTATITLNPAWPPP